MENTGKPAIADGSTLPSVYPNGIKWDIEIPRVDLARMIDESVVKFGPRPAMNFLGKKMTYNDLGNQICRAAKGLQEMGVGRGTKVGICMPNTPYYPIMFFAALKLGATVVNFSPLYTKEELRRQIKDSGTTVMATMDLKDFSGKIDSLLEEGELENVVRCSLSGMLPPLKAMAYRFLKSHDIAPPIKTEQKHVVDYKALTANDGYYRSGVLIHPDDVAVLQYTGGTTSVPKGAMLTHFNLLANCCQIEEFMTAGPDKPAEKSLMHPGHDRILAAIPYFHVFGLTIAMLNGLKQGGELIIVPNPRDLKQVMKSIDSTKPTIFPAVPRLLQAITEDKRSKKYDFSSINSTVTGGAALPSNVKTNFEKLTGKPGLIKQGYGLSETSPVATSNPAWGLNRADTVGLPYPRTEVKIADSEDTDKVLTIGAIGEICIKGPQVMKGYYNRPEENAQAMSGEWFRTGDLGYLDNEYYLHIVGRKKRIININGEKVFPDIIEQEISEHPDVAECVVVGVPDARSGEAAKAFIRFRADAHPVPTEQDMRNFLADRINRIAMPKHMIFVAEELPKTAVGKPDWKKLEDEEKRKYQQQQQPQTPPPQP